MSPSFTQICCFPSFPLSNPEPIYTIDGSHVSSGPIVASCPVFLDIASHSELIDFQLMTCGPHNIILGMEWLHCHNPSIDWKSHHVSFLSDFCSRSCFADPLCYSPGFFYHFSGFFLIFLGFITNLQGEKTSYLILSRQDKITTHQRR